MSASDVQATSLPPTTPVTVPLDPPLSEQNVTPPATTATATGGLPPIPASAPISSGVAAPNAANPSEPSPQVTTKIASIPVLPAQPGSANDAGRATLSVHTGLVGLSRNPSPIPTASQPSIAMTTLSVSATSATTGSQGLPPAPVSKLRADRKLFADLLTLMDAWDGNSPLSEAGRKLLMHALLRMQYPWYGGKNTQRLCHLYSRFRPCLIPASLCTGDTSKRVLAPTSDSDLALAKSTLKSLDERMLPPVATMSMIQQARAYALSSLERLSDRALLAVLLLRLSTHSALTFFLHIEQAFLTAEEAAATNFSTTPTPSTASPSVSAALPKSSSSTGLASTSKTADALQNGCPALLPLGPRIWRPESYRQVFDSKNEIVSWKRRARHPVARMTMILRNDAADNESTVAFPPTVPEDTPCTPSTLQIAVKRAPELPGIEYAFGVFAKMLFGRGAPHTMLIRRRDDPTPFLLSQIESVTTLKQFLEKPLAPEVIATIPAPPPNPLGQEPVLHQAALDPEQVGEQIILAILTRPEDGKPDNYVVRAVSQPPPISSQPVSSLTVNTSDDMRTSDSQANTLASPGAVFLGLPTPTSEARPQLGVAALPPPVLEPRESPQTPPVSTPTATPITRYHIIPIDNDHSFGPSVNETDQRILEKTVLYCLDIMQQPVHPRIATRFKLLDVNGFLRAWADALAEKDAAYLNMWSFDEAKVLLTAKQQPCYIGVPLTREIVLRLQRSLLTVQRLLSTVEGSAGNAAAAAAAASATANASNLGANAGTTGSQADQAAPGTITYLQVLEAVEPAVGGIYRKILSLRNDMDNLLTPIERYTKVLSLASSLDVDSRANSLGGYILALLGREVDVTDALRTHAALSVTAAVQEALGDYEPPSANISVVTAGVSALGLTANPSTNDLRLMAAQQGRTTVNYQTERESKTATTGGMMGISAVVASAPTTMSSRDSEQGSISDLEALDPVGISRTSTANPAPTQPDSSLPPAEVRPTSASFANDSGDGATNMVGAASQIDADAARDSARMVRATRARTLGSISPESVLAPITEFKGDPDRQSRMFAQIKPTILTHIEQKECLKGLTQICGEWHSLHFNGWYAIKAKFFNQFLDRMDAHPFLNINVLTINDCARLDEECVVAISDLMPNLRMLKITNCPGLKRIGRFSLFSKEPLIFPELRHLDVSGCGNLKHILIQAPQLEEYFDSGCPVLEKVSLGSDRLPRSKRSRSVEARKK